MVVCTVERPGNQHLSDRRRIEQRRDERSRVRARVRFLLSGDKRMRILIWKGLSVARVVMRICCIWKGLSAP
jgi:hypothetical protein